MASSKFKFNKKITIQLSLLKLGVFLVFLIYFSDSVKKTNKKVLENVSSFEQDAEETKDTNVFQNVEYRGTDNTGNKYVIFAENSDFELDKPEIINMENIVCYFYFKDETVLEIRSKIGVYNNVSLDMKFSENVNMFYENSTLISDKADYSNSNGLLIIEGNVKTENNEGVILADKLNFDFIDKKLKVSMYNENKVNIKTKN